MATQFCYYGFARFKDGRVTKVIKEEMITNNPLFDNANLIHEQYKMPQVVFDRLKIDNGDGDFVLSAQGYLEIKAPSDQFEAHMTIESVGWEPVDPPNLFEIMERDKRPTWVELVYPGN